MREQWRRFGAIYIFGALWLVLWAVHGVFEAASVLHDAQAHGQPFEWGDWFTEWMRASFENLQSEAWQVMMSALIIERLVSKRKRFAASEEE